MTSIPYEKGFTLLIDGKETKIEMVNTAFIGSFIKKGNHTIELSFEAPYKNISMIISLLSIFCLIGVIYYEKRRPNRID